MKKGIITEVVPEDCFMWPYIGYEVEFSDDTVVVDGYPYENTNYEKRGYVKELNVWDKITSSIFA